MSSLYDVYHYSVCLFFCFAVFTRKILQKIPVTSMEIAFLSRYFLIMLVNLMFFATASGDSIIKLKNWG